MTIRDKLLVKVGGEKAFESSFNWRTFSPAQRAASAIIEGVEQAEYGLAILSVEGVTPEQADQWLAGYVSRWAKYYAAGARTVNWMVTGPARFPVERNNKCLAVERKRGEELDEYIKGAAAWARRQAARIERAELVASDEGGHKEKVVNGIRVVLNKTLHRVQIVFPYKPSEGERAVLKKHAFRWAPSVGAWQRQFTQNGVWAAEAVLKQIAA